MTPVEGSDLEIGLSDPSSGVVGWGWIPIHRSSGFALDLCLFKWDLSEVLFGGCSNVLCIALGDQLAIKREYSFWVKLVGVMWRVAVSSWAWRSVVSVGAIWQLAR